MNRKNSAYKLPGKKTAIIFAAAGAVLLIISYFLSVQKTAYGNEYSTYSAYLEARLSEIISHAGCEDVKVMITLKDSSKNRAEKENESAFSSLKTTGSEEQETTKEIAGVVIVCSSIKETSDFNIIRQAASTALDIPKSKIYIFGGAVNK